MELVVGITNASPGHFFRPFLLTSGRDEVVIEPANTCLQALVDAPRVTAVRHCGHLGKILTRTEDLASDNA